MMWKKRRPIVHLLLRIILLFASCVHGFGGYNKNCEQEESVCVCGGEGERDDPSCTVIWHVGYFCVSVSLFISFLFSDKKEIDWKSFHNILYVAWE
jgi:hypothetical protein